MRLEFWSLDPLDHQDHPDKMVAKEAEVEMDKLEHQECLEDLEWKEKKDHLEEMDLKDFLGYQEDQVMITKVSFNAEIFKQCLIIATLKSVKNGFCDLL